MECKEKADSGNDFLITQYNYLAEEIRFSKRQQMMVTWYIILLFGAIVQTYKYWWPGTHWLTIIFSIIISIFVLVIGLVFMSSCKKSQDNNNKKCFRLNYKSILSYM